MLLLLLLALAAAAAAAAAGAAAHGGGEDARVWEEVVALPDDAGSLAVYTLAVLSVPVPEGGVRVERGGAADGGSANLEDDVELYPEETEHSSAGMAALSCGGFRMESAPAPSAAPARDYLAPLGDEHASEVYEAAAKLFGAAPGAGELRFAVVLSAGGNATASAASADALAARCTFEFVADAPGGGRYVGGAAALALSGSRAVRVAAPGELGASWHPDAAAASAAAAAVLDRGCAEARRRRQRIAAGARAGSAGPEEGGRPLMTVSEFVETDARGWGFESMVGGLVSGIAEPVVETATGAMGDAMTMGLGGSLGSSLEAGLADVIPLTLSRTLAVAVNHVLVPSLSETVTDEVPPRVASNVRDYVLFKLNDRVGDSVATRLETSLGATIPEEAADPIDKQLDADELGVLARVLAKSLTQSMVPALVHTTTHSPMADYYCYYCFHHQQYCPYCVYSPVQLYYAQYYAGYYSTYLSDYYVQFYRDVIDMRHSLAGTELDRRYKQASAGRSVDGHESEVVLEPVTEDDLKGEYKRT